VNHVIRLQNYVIMFDLSGITFVKVMFISELN